MCIPGVQCGQVPFEKFSTLHFAAATGNAGICQLLLDAGADVTLDSVHGATWLHTPRKASFLALYDATDAARSLLIDGGAAVNAEKADGVSPLQVGCTCAWALCRLARVPWAPPLRSPLTRRLRFTAKISRMEHCRVLPSIAEHCRALPSIAVRDRIKAEDKGRVSPLVEGGVGCSV